MGKIQLGETIVGFEIVMVLEEKDKCLTLGKQSEEQWGVFELVNDKIKSYIGMSEDEAKMILFEKSSLTDVLKIYNNIKKDELREICEDEIALYVFGTTEINYRQAKILQKKFDVDKIIENYNNFKNWKKAIEEYMYNDEM